jgi:Cu(I)/Ag(I) efflux system membrane fusion protein
MNWRDPKTYIILILSLLCLWLLFKPQPTTNTQAEQAQDNDAAASEPTIYTCSMHPQIQQPEMGLCPLCGMDLIPLEPGDDSGGNAWALTLTPAAKARAGIQTAKVMRNAVERELELIGKVEIDEKRLTTISSRVAGRIDRMFLDYTGMPVRADDHMVAIYSPDLVTANQELQSALQALDTENPSMRRAAERRLNLVRDKLRLLGLTDSRIEALERGDADAELITVDSPVSGFVMRKHLNEGAYVKEGTALYTIADLSRLWITFQAYESDLIWIRFGQKLNFTIDAYPGETFSGRVSFIDPILNPATRTISVKVDFANEDGRLKPEMLARGQLLARFSATGKVLDPDLEGQWLCPMHPEIVKDDLADCDICGMDLVPAESLGFANETEAESPLVIPESAALLAGDHAVVYVATDEEATRFEGRRVTLGPKANHLFVVQSGLEEGEQVVVNGAFKIDSELQIRAAGSMMYPPEMEEEEHDHASHQEEAREPLDSFETSASFRDQLKPLYQSYFHLQVELSEDRFESSMSDQIKKALDDVNPAELDKAAKSAWQDWKKATHATLADLVAAADLAIARTIFEQVNQRFEDLFTQFGAPADQAIYRYHCPMAFDNRGGDWLQNQQGTANPYYGSMMYRCGFEKAVLQEGGGDE